MFRNLFIIVGLLVFSQRFSLAQNDTINQVDEEGKAQGYWIVYGEDKPEKGYPAEGRIEEGPCVDGKKEGMWIRYYRDGKSIRLKGEYKNNRPNGKYWKYYPDKTLKEHGTYVKKEYVGVLKRYFENGQLKYSGKYNAEGNEIDTVKFYFSNGCPELMYIADSTGKATESYFYYKDQCGVVKSTGDMKPIICYGAPTKVRKSAISRRSSNEHRKNTYSDSALCHGEGEYRKLYNENREIKFDGICKEEKVWEGKMYFYDEDGILEFVEVWKKGAYHSDGQL